MTSTTPQPPPPPPPEPAASPLSRVSDFWAYLLPMSTFLVLTQIGAWWPSLFPISYLIKTIVVAILLYLLRPHYTKIRWNHWWLGVIVGVIGIFQWVWMQLWLQEHVEWFKVTPGAAFDPTQYFAGKPGLMWSFIAVRIAGATLVVPVMEELFWRDWLWRSWLAPNDFKLAEVGEWSPGVLLVVSGMFSVVHGNWWPTAIVWGLMV